MFEYVVLVCPTYTKNESYKGFANNDPRFIVISPDASNVDEVNDILSDITTVFSGYKTLVVLDDCAFSKDLKQRSNKFINLAFSGRHENISVWVLTQQLTAISKPFRENVGCIVSFFTPNKISNQTLFDEYGGELDPEQRKHFMKILKSEKYSRVCFCLRHPFNIYTVNFKVLFQPEIQISPICIWAISAPASAELGTRVKTALLKPIPAPRNTKKAL